MIGRRRSRAARLLAAASATALVAAPSLSRACTVCFGGEETDWNGAFLAGTLVLLLLPPAIIVGGGVVIYRAIKRQEARIAAREVASVSAE